MPSEAEPGGEPVRRLFFALWPDEDVRDRLQAVVAELHDRVAARWVRREQFHITLLFLGAVPESDVLRLRRLELQWPEGFELPLQDLRYLRRRQMIWLIPRKPPEGLGRLVHVLGEGLDARSIGRDLRPFHAHLTLARNARCGYLGPSSAARIGWTVRSVELMESVLDRSGAHYRVLQSWPLQAMPTVGSVE
jgi:2'-5' RNA ligase